MSGRVPASVRHRSWSSWESPAVGGTVAVPGSGSTGLGESAHPVAVQRLGDLPGREAFAASDAGDPAQHLRGQNCVAPRAFCGSADRIYREQPVLFPGERATRGDAGERGATPGAPSGMSHETGWQLLEAAFDRATMEPGELAQHRSRWDAALRRLLEGAAQFRGAGSGSPATLDLTRAWQLACGLAADPGPINPSDSASVADTASNDRFRGDPPSRRGMV